MSEEASPATPAKSQGVVAVGSDVRAMSNAIRRGDEAAFARFYELYSARLYRLLLFLTSGREHAAREALQTTMIKAARKFPLLSTEAELWSWISRVARNALIDQTRREVRHSGGAPEEFWEMIAAGKKSGDPELLRWLEEGLLQLAPEDRQLVDSIYFEGGRQKELADTEGTTRKAVESRLARIRLKLRQHILGRMKNE